MILAVVIALVAQIDVRAQAAWAHQNGSITPSGALVIKGLGGGSYNGTQNPTGAVAKGNQAAATQPATVVIQATNSGGNIEAVPLISASGSPPACPAGYTVAFTVSSGAGMAACPTSTFNIAGSRFSLVTYNNGYPLIGFFIDNQLTPTGQPFPSNGMGMQSPYCGTAWPAGSWSARLCTK